jgi:hypothetical protein
VGSGFSRIAAWDPALAGLRTWDPGIQAVLGLLLQTAVRHALWQRYGYERVIRDSEQTFVVARYILENPVRAGLVAAIKEYPFVGSFVYTLPELIASVYESNQQESG